MLVPSGFLSHFHTRTCLVHCCGLHTVWLLFMLEVISCLACISSYGCRSVPKPLAPGPLFWVLFICLVDRNAGWRCSAMGAFSSVVLLGLQVSPGNRSAQPYVSGPLRLQGGQQQRHRPQPIFVGGAKYAMLSTILSKRAHLPRKLVLTGAESVLQVSAGHVQIERRLSRYIWPRSTLSVAMCLPPLPCMCCCP